MQSRANTRRDRSTLRLGEMAVGLDEFAGNGRGSSGTLKPDGYNSLRRLQS